MSAAFIDREILKFNKPKTRQIIIGIISAIGLYCVFYAGNAVSGLIIPMKESQIADVYMNSVGTSRYVIGAALLFVIGPGEEIFWRGYIQKTLSKKYGVKSIIMTAFLYTAVHVVTLNFMLIMAALTCGIFWGALYYRERSLYPVIISHAIWDITVFLLLPFS